MDLNEYSNFPACWSGAKHRLGEKLHLFISYETGALVNSGASMQTLNRFAPSGCRFLFRNQLPDSLFLPKELGATPLLKSMLSLGIYAIDYDDARIYDANGSNCLVWDVDTFKLIQLPVKIKFTHNKKLFQQFKAFVVKVNEAIALTNTIKYGYNVPIGTVSVPDDALIAAFTNRSSPYELLGVVDTGVPIAPVEVSAPREGVGVTFLNPGWVSYKERY